jgi:two-component system chemotaxis response regulator CheB
MGKLIRVLVVEDSPVARELLVHVLSSDPDLQVVATASNGEAALAAITRHNPDVVTMDIEMPGMDGYETTRRIMATQPVPVVLVSSRVTPEDVAMSFSIAEAGALAAVEKPGGPGAPGHEAMARRLTQTVKLMSEVKVVRRWNRDLAKTGTAATNGTMPEPDKHEGPQIVAIGASTGGPPVLQKILTGLSPQFPLPIVIVQHIAPGFLQGMVEWLIQTTGFRVRIAIDGETFRPGYAYFAPDGKHLGVRRYANAPGRAWLSDAPLEHNLRPAVAFLFRAVAETYGKEAIGVLLTGMGRDGAAELKTLRDKGAITIAQDKETSVVHGMPGEAVALGAARHILPPDEITKMLTRLARRANL